MSYCPTCQTEYGAQMEFCSTCRFGLVASLPESIELAEWASFPNVPSAEMLREILERNGTRSVQRGEVDPIGISSGAQEVTLLVEESDRPQARELCEAYFAGPDAGEPDPGRE